MAQTKKQHDCGVHGSLTVYEIAARTGVSRQGIVLRIAQGVRGEALLAPKSPRGRKVGSKPAFRWRPNRPSPLTFGVEVDTTRRGAGSQAFVPE
jgi:hypothetical protein